MPSRISLSHSLFSLLLSSFRRFPLCFDDDGTHRIITSCAHFFVRPPLLVSVSIIAPPALPACEE